MLPRPSRVFALLLQSDRRRLAASLLTPLLLGLTFGCGYIAALSVGEADAITPVDEPLVATIDLRTRGARGAASNRRRGRRRPSLRSRAAPALPDSRPRSARSRLLASPATACGAHHHL